MRDYTITLLSVAGGVVIGAIWSSVVPPTAVLEVGAGAWLGLLLLLLVTRG